MPTSVEETIFAAVATKLDAIAGYSFERNLSREVQISDVPMIILIDGDDDQTPYTTGSDLYHVRFDVELFVSGASDAELGPALSELQAKVKATLEDPADPKLGIPAVRDVRYLTRSQPDFIGPDAAQRIYGTALAYEVDFETAEGDPYTAG